MNCASPPAFCSHLPTPRPRTDTADATAMNATLTTGVYHAVRVSQALDGSRTYERFVATITAKVGIIRMLYAQRFQPTMNPSVLPNPTVAH